MGLDYVDIFYHHRPDPTTPLEETMGALHTAVRSGKALYAGISSYSRELTREAARILADLGTPLLIHQPSYSMLNRWIETEGLLDTLADVGAGCIAFSPLAQGMLTDKYLDGVPPRARGPARASRCRPGAAHRRRARRTSARSTSIASGARPEPGADGAGLGAAQPGGHLGAGRRQQRAEQMQQNVAALGNLEFTDDELRRDRPARRRQPASTCGRPPARRAPKPEPITHIG